MDEQLQLVAHLQRDRAKRRAAQRSHVGGEHAGGRIRRCAVPAERDLELCDYVAQLRAEERGEHELYVERDEWFGL